MQSGRAGAVEGVKETRALWPPGDDREMADAPAASGAAPRGSLLKAQSNYSTSGRSAPPKPVTGQKISFADEHGDPIAENHFVDGLHYSEQSTTVTRGGPRGCCSIS